MSLVEANNINSICTFAGPRNLFYNSHEYHFNSSDSLFKQNYGKNVCDACANFAYAQINNRCYLFLFFFTPLDWPTFAIIQFIPSDSTLIRTITVITFFLYSNLAFIKLNHSHTVHIIQFAYIRFQTLFILFLKQNIIGFKCIFLMNFFFYHLTI